MITFDFHRNTKFSVFLIAITRSVWSLYPPILLVTSAESVCCENVVISKFHCFSWNVRYGMDGIFSCTSTHLTDRVLSRDIRTVSQDTKRFDKTITIQYHCGVFPKWKWNSVNSSNSGNLINHWNTNWSQFKDPMYHLCLTGAVIASRSVTLETTGLNCFNGKYFLSLTSMNSVKTFKENSYNTPHSVESNYQRALEWYFFNCPPKKITVGYISL